MTPTREEAPLKLPEEGKPLKPTNYAPVYCALYPELATLVREHGYALAIHGSLARDMDLICIPWAPFPSDPDKVVNAITGKFALREIGGPPSSKLHGRIAYTISIAWGRCAIDLSFMPHVKEQLPSVSDLSKLNDKSAPPAPPTSLPEEPYAIQAIRRRVGEAVCFSHERKAIEYIDALRSLLAEREERIRELDKRVEELRKRYISCNEERERQHTRAEAAERGREGKK